MVRRLAKVALLLAFAVWSAGCVSVPAIGGGDRSLYDRLTAASVEVLIDGRLAGSGWFVEPGNLIVSAAHVVWPRGECEVLTPAGDRLTARAVAWDRAHDVVLLRVEGVGPNHPTLPLADAMPTPPAKVHLLGMPQFRHDVLITGHVARARPTFEYYADSGTYLRCFHISAPAPKGASGGCWVDVHGRVIGVQSGVMRNSEGPSGIAFAGPVSAIRQLIERGISAANVTAHIAVEELAEQPVDFVRDRADHPQALVAKQVAEGGVGHQAGLRDGVLITAVNGQHIRRRDDFYRAIRKHKAGDAITLTIVVKPGAASQDITVTLAAMEAVAPQLNDSDRRRFPRRGRRKRLRCADPHVQ